jgi:hypothetical protein
MRYLQQHRYQGPDTHANLDLAIPVENIHEQFYRDNNLPSVFLLSSMLDYITGIFFPLFGSSSLGFFFGAVR